MRTKKIPSNELERYSQSFYKTKNVISLIVYGIAAFIFWFIAFYLTWQSFEYLGHAVILDQLGGFLIIGTCYLAGLLALAGVVEVGSEMISDFIKGRSILMIMERERASERKTSK